MTNDAEIQAYSKRESIVFRKTREAYGGLSNMAAGYPLSVNGIRVLTSEALYQACRFPTLPNIQKLVISQASPMSAKMVGKPYREETREDWDDIRVQLMRWCLQVKLAQHFEVFGELLRATGTLPIVEESSRDAFWGAKPLDDDTLRGHNMLGRLLMELRASLLAANAHALRTVAPLQIPDFLLMGRQIEPIVAPTSQGPVGAETQPGVRQMQLDFFANE